MTPDTPTTATTAKGLELADQICNALDDAGADVLAVLSPTTRCPRTDSVTLFDAIKILQRFCAATDSKELRDKLEECCRWIAMVLDQVISVQPTPTQEKP